MFSLLLIHKDAKKFKFDVPQKTYVFNFYKMLEQKKKDSQKTIEEKVNLINEMILY